MPPHATRMTGGARDLVIKNVGLKTVSNFGTKLLNHKVSAPSG